MTTELDLLDLLNAGSNDSRLVAELEAALVSERLAAVIDDLQRLVPLSAHDDTLAEVLGEHQDDVLEKGLSALPRERLNRLLQQPGLLVDLQEEVLLAETPYWEARLDGVVPEQPLTPVVLPAPKQGDTDITRNPVAAMPAAPAPAAAVERTGSRLGWLIPLAAAAAVAAFWIWPGESPWGWQQRGAFTAELAAPEYLRHLAQLAGSFEKSSLDSAPALDRRLTEMLAGCRSLLEAPHPQLAEADRKWLRERCEAWETKFKEQQQRLRAPDVGAEVVADVRVQSLKIVNTLREKLNERAELLGKQAALLRRPGRGGASPS
jgi:hypothetical protein